MAAVDYFLEIDGVKGESPDAKYKQCIQLESWSWGETNSGTHSAGGGGGAGKVMMQDFHFVKKFDKSSPSLFLNCAVGKHIPKARLICRKAGEKQQEYLTIKFSDLLISSYQTGGSAHGDVVPTDQISLNFSKIEFEYKEQMKDGQLGSPFKAGYDVKAQKAV